MKCSKTFSEPFPRSSCASFLAVNNHNNIVQVSMFESQMKVLMAAYGQELTLTNTAELRETVKMISDHAGMSFKAKVRNNTVYDIIVKRRQSNQGK